MDIKKIWELPMLSAQLEDEPEIIIKQMNIVFSICYYDESLKKNKIVKIKFNSVLCHKHTSERFTKAMLDAYDTVVEIYESDWLKELYKLNERDYEFWKPKHYAIYFDGNGLYQFIARSFEVEE